MIILTVILLVFMIAPSMQFNLKKDNIAICRLCVQVPTNIIDVHCALMDVSK